MSLMSPIFFFCSPFPKGGSLNFIKVSSLIPSLPPSFSPSFPQQCIPDRNGHCRTPTARTPDHSRHCRTSTASCRCQWALQDLNSERQIVVCNAGLHLRVPDLSGHCRSSWSPTASSDLSGHFRTP